MLEKGVKNHVLFCVFDRSFLFYTLNLVCIQILVNNKFCVQPILELFRVDK